MTPNRIDHWEVWLAAKPPAIRELAIQYPPRSRFRCHGKILHAISYGECKDGTATLEVTEIDPSEDYALAVAKRQAVCQCCLPKLAALRIENAAPNTGHEPTAAKSHD